MPANRLRIVKLNTGASGGFTSLCIDCRNHWALGNTDLVDGTFAMLLRIENNNVGQTATVTAGDGSTTLTAQ